MRHIAHIENAYKILVERIEGEAAMERLHIHRKIILSWI
jgi:hypothetical protein